jgi:nucleotide-binding universal stress UspA family protein
MGKYTFGKILIFAESSTEGMEAARVAIDLASDEDAVLHIVSVVDTHTLRQLLKNRIFVEDEMKQYEGELEKSCRKQMDYVARLASEAKVDNRAQLKMGACHTAIIEEQKKIDADLLVMGTYRTSMIKTDLMAREKQLIVDEIACPVLLVPEGDN